MPDWERIGGGGGEDGPMGPLSQEGDGGPARTVPGLGSAAFRTLVEDTDEGIVLANAEGRVVFANPACERIFGAPRDQLLGRRGMELTRPEHVLLAREIFTRVLTSPTEPVLSTVDLMQPSGRIVTVDVKAVNHLQTPGVEALVGYFRESEARDSGFGESYRALFDNALVGLGVADMQGNLLAFNDAMLRPGGYAREDIIRIGNVAKLYARDADRASILQMLRAKGYVWREKVAFLAKDGSTYDTLMTLTPVSFLGRPCLYATVEVVDGSGRPGPARAP